ncbi:MAG: alpha/beta hydrolase [Lachnospiraceae bacterium]|nr:alpha/beta hydrolase [Lachnospiraceae bacterium]
MNQYRSKKAGEKILRTYDNLMGQWGIAYEERMIVTAYGDTHVTICGKKDGEPLVLFHGVGDDSALMWLYNAKVLGKEFRLYAVDTIGGPGKSQIGEEYNEKFDDVAWIDAVLDGLLLKQVLVAGVSHGGYLTQLYTAARPERVRKGIALASAVASGSSENNGKIMMKIFMPEALFPTRKNTERLLKKLAGDHYQVFTQNEAIMEHYTYLLRGFNNMAMRYHVVRPLTKEELDIVREKVTFLAGEKDPFEQLGGKELMRKEKVKVFFYPEAGHGINHEIAETINQKMIEILRD